MVISKTKIFGIDIIAHVLKYTLIHSQHIILLKHLKLLTDDEISDGVYSGSYLSVFMFSILIV